jgi:branched-chain amino acid transport system permease protein
VGNAAYFGIGAYTTIIVYLTFAISPWLGILIGAAFASAFALAIGFPLFRLGGRYFVLATWAVSEIFRLTFKNTKATGGAKGIWVPVVKESWWHFQFHTSRMPYYYILLIFLILYLIICWKIRYSSLGLNLMAVRDDERAAESLGINVFKYKQVALTISAGMTAIIGGFYAQYQLFIDPDSAFLTQVSIDILFPAVLGGLGTVNGTLLGSVILFPVYWILRVFLGYSPIHLLIRGILLMIIVGLAPSGIIPSIFKRLKPQS